MYKIENGSNGVITLKGAPLHSGHIYAITQASTQVEHLYVILSFDQKWLDNLEYSEFWGKHLTKKKRLLWLKRTFQNLDHVTILCLDETDMGAYPEGLESWTNEVDHMLMDEGVMKIDKWFSSEPDYTWWIEKYFDCPNIIIDAEREMFNISATKIRANPYKYWEFLPSIVRKEFLLKVVLIGTESCGKSTLTKYLAKTYNTSWVEEYGRIFCEVDMCMDETLLDYADYGHIAATRNYEEKQAESGANKILFCDTNAFITQFYCELYENCSNDLVDSYINIEKYDLILHMDDQVEWVDDGLRINPDRSKSGLLFTKMLDKYNIKNDNGYHYITGDYKQRLSSVMNIINNKLKNWNK